MDGNEKILATIKKMLGPAEDYDHFNPDIMFHINTALSILRQLGVGPLEGFRISTGDETWAEFLGDGDDLEMAKDYVYMKVKLAFDPPSNSALLSAYQELVKEFEWRALVEPEIQGL